MTVVDANLLIYTYNADVPQQSKAARWFKRLAETEERLALPWVAIWAFVRVSTSPRVFENPLPAAEAFAIVGRWLALPNVVLVEPGPRHLEILQRLVTEHSATGPMVTDAVLAALAIENGAVLASADQGFSRYKGLRWVNPLTA